MRQVSFTDLEEYLPTELRSLEDPQTAIPAIAKDRKLLAFVDAAVQQVPTIHDLYLGDAREMPGLAPGSVHLVLTSPPYRTLKEYRDAEGQLGHVTDYEGFLEEGVPGPVESGQWLRMHPRLSGSPLLGNTLLRNRFI